MGWFDGSSKWASGKAKQPTPDEVDAGKGWLPPRAAEQPERRRRGEVDPAHAEPEWLGPGWGRWVWAGLLTVATLLVGLMWIGTLNDFISGSRSIAETAILGLITVVLLGLMLATGYVVLSLTNPKVLICFDSRIVELGQPLALRWQVHGRAGRFHYFQVKVRAFERVYYTRGTDRITEEHTLLEETIFEREMDDEFGPAAVGGLAPEGEATLPLPLGTMHSLSADNNLVIWEVEVRGVIRRWPDVRHRHDFTVVPPGWG